MGVRPLVPFYSTHEVQLFAEDHGSYFFTKETMRFFRSRVNANVWHGVFFITSEQQDGYARKYTIRRVKSDGDITKVGEFQQYSTLAQAKKAVERLVVCFDAGDQVFDRYTVTDLSREVVEGSGVFPYLAMSDNPTHPQGLSLFGEWNKATIHEHMKGGGDVGKKVDFWQLPERIRQHVLDRMFSE
jgi:hypothetical protein